MIRVRRGAGRLTAAAVLHWVCLLGAGCTDSASSPDGGASARYAWSRFAAAPPSHPPERFGMPLVVLETEQRMIGFGGSHQPIGSVEAATWMFTMDDQAWTQALDLTTPLARYGHCAAYLPAQNEMLLVGGRDEDGLLPVEAWTYQVATRQWSRVTGTMPAGVVGCVAVFAPRLANGTVIVFGGFGADGAEGKTWSYDPLTRKFTRILPPHAPSPRFDAHAVWDDAGERLLLFGGAEGTPATPTPRGDLWAFDGAEWIELEPDASPPARRAGAHALLTEERQWLLHGGAGLNGDLDDTWLYQAATNQWTQLPVKGERPSARAFSSFGYDRFTRSFLLFGGFVASSGAPSAEGWRLGWSAP